MTSDKDLIDYIISDKKNILETIEDHVTDITYDTLRELVESYGYKLYDNAACIDVKLRPNITLDVEKELDISREQFFGMLYDHEIPNFAEDLSLSFDNFVVHGRSGGYWGLDGVKEQVELTDKFAEDLAAEILGDSIEYWVEYRKDYVDDFRNLDPEELVYDYIKNVSTDSNVLELNDTNYLELNKDYLSELKSLSDDIDFMEKEWNDPSYWEEPFNESLKRRKTMTLNEDIQKILEEDVKIKTKNPGILEVPEGKNFWDLPLKHYKELVDKKGYAKVIRALTNLEVWNKNDDPDISKKASKIADDLKKFYKKESLNEENNSGAYINSAASIVLNEKLDDLELKIKNIRYEIRNAFPSKPISNSSDEIIDQIKNKYNEVYSLIDAAVKSIDEIPNKLK